MLNATIRNGEIDGEVNGEINYDNGELNSDLLHLNKSELAIYRLIRQAPDTSRQAMAELTGISARTVDRAIKSIVDKCLIKRIGSKKTGH